MKKLLFAGAALLALVGCTRVETGEVGLRKTFNGVVELQPLGTGFHQTMVGSVLLFSAREIMLPLEDLHPQTKDKITMKEVDVSFTYSVEPSAIGELYTKYGAASHLYSDNHGEIYVMGQFVSNLMTSAVADEIATHDALVVNTQRDAVVTGIAGRIQAKLKHEGLEDNIKISQIVLKVAAIPEELAASANKQAEATNALNAMTTEVLTAQKEATKIQALAAQATPGYINLLNAQAKLELAKNCGKTTIWVVPDNFTGLGNIHQ